MLSISKTIELLGQGTTPEQAEDIRSFAYELAELLLDGGANYQELITNHEKDDNCSGAGNRLGNGGGVIGAGAEMEKDATPTISDTTSGSVS